MSIHEQARAEAEKVWPSSLYSEAVDWRAGFAKGFLAGHEAATRTRVVTTATELDALPVGSVFMDGTGGVWQVVREEESEGGYKYESIGRGGRQQALTFSIGYDLPARVLHDPEEEQAATTTAADPDAYRPVERFGAEGGRLLPARTGSVDTHTDTPEEDT